MNKFDELLYKDETPSIPYSIDVDTGVERWMTVTTIGDDVPALKILDNLGINYSAKSMRHQSGAFFSNVFTFIQIPDLSDRNLIKSLYKIGNSGTSIAHLYSECASDPFNTRYDILNNYTEYRRETV